MSYLILTFLLVGCGDKKEEHVPPVKRDVVQPTSEKKSDKDAKKAEKSSDEVPPIPAKKVEEIEGPKESKDDVKEEK